MFAHSCKYPVWAIAILSLASLVGIQARAQETYELRCRGRGGAFAIDPIDANTVSLRFTASPRAAGATNAGLDPGTCSWVDRAINSAEPLQIHFAADSSRAAFVAQRLNDPGNYWAFFVFNTNQGYFEAKSHNALTTGPSTGESTSRRVNADITSRQPQASNADITPRRSVMDPPVKQSIDKNRLKDEDVRVPVITDVTATPVGQSVTISFTTFPNAVPLVELGSNPPVRGADRRWSFPSGSGVVTQPAGGDRASGKYAVEMRQELDPGSTYYYIINVKKESGPGGEMRQTTGKFRTPGASLATSYNVRYKGFHAEKTTTGPGDDEIYVIVSISFVDPSGKPVTATGRYPRNVQENVGSDESYGTKEGATVYEGPPVNLLLTVTVMEHDSGDPDKYRKEAGDAANDAFVALLAIQPQLFVPLFVAPSAVLGAVNTVGIAVSDALGGSEDDVIGTATTLITAGEMKEIGNRPGPKPGMDGIDVPYDFFTDHRGQGGIYRVYFDIIPR